MIKSFEGCDDIGNVEFMKASSALSCMSSMARYINEMKRIHDKNVKMKEILDLLIACNPNVNLSGSGELIIEVIGGCACYLLRCLAFKDQLASLVDVLQNLISCQYGQGSRILTLSV